MRTYFIGEILVWPGLGADFCGDKSQEESTDLLSQTGLRRCSENGAFLVVRSVAACSSAAVHAVSGLRRIVRKRL